MESFSDFDTLPPGFRFHPTDEELITHYLSHKVKDDTFCSKAIGEVDLNRVEPWDLTWEAKTSKNECYYFCMKDRKYPNGVRTNRATRAGYWKPAGKDQKIFRASKILVGTKKYLIFYKGRAPRGEKTNWCMHEYRLEGKHSLNEWVICRIFIKGSGGGETVHNTTGDLPPPTDVSSAFAFEGFPNSTAGVGDASVKDLTACGSSVFGHLPSIFSNDSDPVGSFQVTPPGVGLSHNDEAGFSDDLSVQETGFMARDDLDFVDGIYGLWN